MALYRSLSKSPEPLQQFLEQVFSSISPDLHFSMNLPLPKRISTEDSRQTLGLDEEKISPEDQEQLANHLTGWQLRTLTTAYIYHFPR